ncbi:MAG: ABC transporter permease [Fimbriiglobus sp.]|nr:ABC transporter permease [Fimbriiglobus sp.]
MPSEPLRTLGWSAWLGWQIESNWADLRLFLLYLVVKPVCGAMLLVLVFYAADFAIQEMQGTRLRADFLPFIYISNACYGLVGTVMFGMSYVVISDRESYRMLKYIYISPAQFQAYFVGRGLARGLEGLVGGIVIIVTGLLIPKVREAVHFAGVDLPLLLAFLGVGAVMLWACGMILASAVLNMSRSGMFLSEGVGALVYFLSGVVFPVDMLPVWLRPVSLCLPTTYWLEGMRRAITGNPASDSPLGQSPLAAWDNGQLLLALTATTAGLVVVSQFFYRWSVRKAWRTGKLEEVTGV